MKWTTFDTTSFPTVFVDFGSTLDDEGFEDFKNQWKSLYSHHKDFYLIFETKDVGWVNPKYAWKMAEFMAELKEQQRSLGGKEYLQQSFIFYNSWYIKFLLKIIFYLHPPIAPVEIMSSDKNVLEIFRLKNNIN